VQIGVDRPYPDTVRRSAALLIIVSHFVEVVFVQLAHETGEVAVLEVLRQDVFREFLVLRASSANAPSMSGSLLRIFHVLTSSTTKLSPSLPHRTTLSSCGLSNILEKHSERLHGRNRVPSGCARETYL
jgi:hypothetical protein